MEKNFEYPITEDSPLVREVLPAQVARLTV